MKELQQIFAHAELSFHLQIQFEDLPSKELGTITNYPLLVVLSVLHIVKWFLVGEPSSKTFGGSWLRLYLYLSVKFFHEIRALLVD
jgi:hypothetical protein